MTQGYGSGGLLGTLGGTGRGLLELPEPRGMAEDWMAALEPTEQPFPDQIGGSPFVVATARFPGDAGRDTPDIVDDGAEPGDDPRLDRLAAEMTRGRTPAGPPPKGASPEQIQRFFNVLHTPLTDLAASLSVPDHYVLGLSAHESGYYDDHNRDLVNPLGFTAAGKNNLKFSSLDDAIAYWRKLYGPQVQGATSPDDFVQRLQGMIDGKPVPGWRRYNVKDPDWMPKVKGVINSVGRREQDWKNNRNFDR